MLAAGVSSSRMAPLENWAEQLDNGRRVTETMGAQNALTVHRSSVRCRTSTVPKLKHGGRVCTNLHGRVFSIFDFFAIFFESEFASTFESTFEPTNHSRLNPLLSLLLSVLWMVG